MKKLLLTILLILSLDIILAQNDTILIRQMNSILNSIKTIDTKADLIKKQKMHWRGKSTKIKCYSETDKTIKHKVRLYNEDGNIFARHKLRSGYYIKIKMITKNDVPIFIKRKDTKNNVTTTFTYLGNSKWYFNYSAENLSKKYFVTVDISQWR